MAQRHVFMKQKISILSKYDIFDENENPIYHVAGKAGGMTFTVENLSNNTTATIKKKISLVQKYEVKFENGDRMELNKKVAVVEQEFHGELNGSPITVDGDFLAFDFDILVDGKIIGGVNKKILRIRDSYCIEAVDERWLDAVVVIAVCIDNAMHKR